MSNPTQSHYNIAQRIEDRRTGDRVTDIDAIAQALAEAERLGRDDTDSANLLSIIADIREKSGLGAKPMLGDLADAIAARIDDARREERERAARLLDAVTSPFKRAGKDRDWTDLLDLLRAAILSMITDEAR